VAAAASGRTATMLDPSREPGALPPGHPIAALGRRWCVTPAEEAGRRLSDPTAQIDALDGVRGVAVLLVLLSHLSISRLYLIPPADLAGAGKAGVYLFFVLSAFLLTLGFLRKGAASLGWRELGVYALRRFLRIYPLFVIALAIACLHLEGVSHGRALGFDITKFWANLTLQRGDGVFWTIGVEFKYYLVIPVIAFAHLVVFRRRILLSSVALAAAIVGASAAWPMSVDADINIVSLGPFLPIFLAGSLAAILFERWPQPASPWPYAASVAACAAAVAAVILIPPFFGGITGVRSATALIDRLFLVWGMVWGSVVLGSLTGGSWPRRLFEVRWLRRFGQLCLGSYLFHPFILSAIRLAVGRVGIGNTYAEAWLAIAAVFGVAELTLRFIERPLSNTRPIETWARPSRRRPAPVALPAETPAP
jgi:peptidoglycan/LPS O-acetylase OafA/YrhL